MMNLFENLQMMSESSEDKIINVKLMDVEILGDDDDYDAWDEHLNELANEYNITIEANGERSVLISGTRKNIEEFLYSEYFLDFDSNHVVVIDTLKEAEENSYDPNNYIWDGKSGVPKDVVNVTIKDGVTKIKDWAFCDCESLKEINIPNSVTTIGSNAFKYCSSLQKINIPNGVTTIEDDTFSNCESLKEIDIPNSVTIIKFNAFWACSSLQKVNIPNSVTIIRRDAFSFCKSLKEINIPNSSADVDPIAFRSCPNIKVYKNGKLINNVISKPKVELNIDDDYDIDTDNNLEEILSVVDKVFRNLYLNNQDHMDEEEFDDLYNSVADGNNDDFIDGVIEDVTLNADYEYDELDDNYREYITSRCIELAQEEGFGD